MPKICHTLSVGTTDWHVFFLGAYSQYLIWPLLQWARYNNLFPCPYGAKPVYSRALAGDGQAWVTQNAVDDVADAAPWHEQCLPLFCNRKLWQYMGFLN